MTLHVFLPEELTAKLIITEKRGAACLFKICTEFCFPGTRRQKHIHTIPWILGSFQSAVNSEAHRHLYLLLLSFYFSQTMPSVHLRLMFHCLLFSPSFLFLLLSFLPKAQIFTEWNPAKPLCPWGSVICRVTPSYDWRSFCCFSYFIIWMSSEPELMPVETSWAFIFWYMGYHKLSHSLGTYLAGQLMACVSAPCHSTFSWTMYQQADQSTYNHQAKGWGTSFRLINTQGTEDMCECCPVLTNRQKDINLNCLLYSGI